MQTEEEIRRKRLLEDPNSPLAKTLRGIPHITVPDDLKDIALGEDYGKSGPSLYRITQRPDGVDIAPFKFGERRPMDERTPAGQSVSDLLNRVQQPPAFDMLRNVPSPMQQLQQPPPPPSVPPASPSPRIAVSSQPAVGIVGSLPQPSAGLAAPEPPPTPTFSGGPIPTGTLGPSVTGQDQLNRNLTFRDILAQADPESDVRIRNGQIDESPPGMSGVNRKGRLRRGFAAGLAAFGSADPDRPLYSLGQGLGGLATGLISPRSGAKIERKFELDRLDNDIARGLKLKQEEAQLGGIEALRRQRELEPAIQAEKINQENERLEIERKKAAGLITKEQADRAERELDRKERERHNRENERLRGLEVGASATGSVTNEQIEANIAEASRERDGLAEALKTTPQQVEEIDAYGDKRMKPNPIYTDYMNRYRKLDDDIRDWRMKRKGSTTTSTSATTQPYAGRTMSQANLEKYAKDKGLSVEDARKQVEAQGVRISEVAP